MMSPQAAPPSIGAPMQPQIPMQQQQQHQQVEHFPKKVDNSVAYYSKLSGCLYFL